MSGYSSGHGVTREQMAREQLQVQHHQSQTRLAAGSVYLQRSNHRPGRRRSLQLLLEQQQQQAEALSGSATTPSKEQEQAVAAHMPSSGLQGQSCNEGAINAKILNATVVEVELPSGGTTNQESQSVYVMRFLSGGTHALEEVVSGVKTLAPFRQSAPRRIAVAGGGAHKYRDLFKQALNLDFQAHREMESVVEGLRFVLERPHIFRGEILTISDQGDETVFDPDVHEVDPVLDAVEVVPVEQHPMWEEAFLVVNIGSGVSILHVTPDSFARVGGTGCGGGTFLGLTKLLCGTSDFAQSLELASGGDAKNIDTLMRRDPRCDIYGHTGSAHLGLPPSLTASNFGKLGTLRKDKETRPEPADLARAVLQMVTQQVAVLAVAYSQSLLVRHIFFVGGFFEKNN
eukprot:g8150.t1